MPALTPVTTPFNTVATDVLLLNQVPPGVVLLSVVVEPTQTVNVPVSAFTVGNAFTRIDFVAVLTLPLLYAFNVIV